VVFGTLGQRSPVSREAIRAVLAATPALRYLDLNLRDGPNNRRLAQESVALADWLKVNEDELALLLRWFVSDTAAAAPIGSAEHHAAVAALMAHFALDRVVLTLGAQGYASWGPGGVQDARGASPAPARLVDTVGAGDAFSAALLALHALGRPLPMALALAARYASAICAERGPIPTQDSFFVHWRQEFGLAASAEASASASASAPGNLPS
jgi:fructokinase